MCLVLNRAPAKQWIGVALLGECLHTEDEEPVLSVSEAAKGVERVARSANDVVRGDLTQLGVEVQERPRLVSG